MQIPSSPPPLADRPVPHVRTIALLQPMQWLALAWRDIGCGWVSFSHGLVLVLAPDGYVFELWLAVGGVLAAPIFASTAISIPLMLGHASWYA